MTDPSPLGEAPRLRQLIEKWRTNVLEGGARRHRPSGAAVTLLELNAAYRDLQEMALRHADELEATLKAEEESNCYQELRAAVLTHVEPETRRQFDHQAVLALAVAHADDSATMDTKLAEGAARRGPPCQTCQGRGWVMHTEHHDLGNGLASGGAWNEPCPDCALVRSSAPPQPQTHNSEDKNVSRVEPLKAGVDGQDLSRSDEREQ